MKREVIAGNVLDLQARAEAPLFVGKRCCDCAHFQKSTTEFEPDRCGRSVKVDFSTGTEGYFACSIERAYDVGCGPRAIHFIPTEAALAARSVRRLQRQLEIENAIEAHNPDAMDAQELLAALTASLQARYGDAANDALEQAQDFKQALEELESTLGAMDPL